MKTVFHSNSSSHMNSKARPKDASSTHSDQNYSFATDSVDYYDNRNSNFSACGPCEDVRVSGEGSPMTMSPWNNTASFMKPARKQGASNGDEDCSLIGSLVREEGHIYSLATKHGDLLYTGSDSKNIRVWKNLKEYAGFKSSSGLVKAIVIAGEKIFTGHQDGKIRIWKVSPKNMSVHKRYGSLPTLKDIFKSSMRPSHYIEVKRRRSVWIKHTDAISCLGLVENQGLLYSASWDHTFKVWRISDSKCLESIPAHDDAVNAVVTSCTDGLVFTGSADGTVKVWHREAHGKTTKHFLTHTLLKQECAITALAVDPTGCLLYSGSSDGLVNFWDRERNLAHGGTLRGHKLAVLCLEARGRLVFSGSADKSICVWRRDGVEHTCLSVLRGHTGPVKCLAVEENKESGPGGPKKWKVYSGSLDKSVKVWSVVDQSNEIVCRFEAGTDSLRSDRSDF
ncbi:hypothetical protein V2J09_007194 [Rumex salicifolius]